jgi:hypothetical protein
MTVASKTTALTLTPTAIATIGVSAAAVGWTDRAVTFAVVVNVTFVEKLTAVLENVVIADVVVATIVDGAVDDVVVTHDGRNEHGHLSGGFVQSCSSS